MTRGSTRQPPTSPFPAQLSSGPQSLRHRRWEGGGFTTAYRPPTPFVEGEILSPNHLVMVTLQGGAKRHEIEVDGGHRFDGPDRPGSVSFLPAACTRRLRLHSVEWRWATISLSPEADPAFAVLQGVRPFGGIQDLFIQSMLAEFDRLDTVHGDIDPLWRGNMVQALVSYLSHRHAAEGTAKPSTAHALTPWQLRRVNDFIEARLSGQITMGDLAAVCRISEGHFYRAFRKSTGITPLQHVTARRVDLARQLLATSGLSVGEIALEVGFASPSHFARVFQQATGDPPLNYRRRHRVT